MSDTQRWWMIQASAPLQAVATQNYACFGRGGVPRYAGQRAANAPTPTPSDPVVGDSASLCVELIIRAPENTATTTQTDEKPAIRFAKLDITLTPHEKSTARVIWSGYDPAQHVQTIWVWDFFRLLSQVVLRVADIPPDAKSDAAPDPAWQNALDGLRAAAVDDVLTVNVRSVCGDIHQHHTLHTPAIRWEPEYKETHHGKNQH
ncbi:MAG: hypothetical protein JXA10_02360 [Anaerolineae bacterium]|nr:hypothetical protein [Anaerolineae bacterium]